MLALMMRKTFKFLPVFFMLLAWMIITAHQIIPHDHHLGEPTAEKEHSCPATDNRQDHHNGFPMHCHAFNDLTSEKVVKFILANYIHFTLLSSGGFFYAFQPESITVTFMANEPDLPAYHFLRVSSLRAPPSQS
jgi:hypothetical protein